MQEMSKTVVLYQNGSEKQGETVLRTTILGKTITQLR